MLALEALEGRLLLAEQDEEAQEEGAGVEARRRSMCWRSPGTAQKTARISPELRSSPAGTSWGVVGCIGIF